MVLTELRPESWMGATCTVSRCSDRCQGASAREGTNYRTAAQQTPTPPWGLPSISLPCPPTLDPRPGTNIANSSPPVVTVRPQPSNGGGRVYKVNFLPDRHPIPNERLNEFSPTAVWVNYKGTPKTLRFDENECSKLTTVMQPVMEHNKSPKAGRFSASASATNLEFDLIPNADINIS